MLEAELFAFLENTADAAFALRDSGEICFWNKAAEELFGYPAEEVLGKTCSNVLRGVGALGTNVCQERCVLMQCAAQSTRIPNFDLHVTTRDEGKKWCNVSSIHFHNHRTGTTLLVHLARDISLQKSRDETYTRMVALSRDMIALDQTKTGTAPVAQLSSQELEILRLLAEGASPAGVSKALTITPQTLRNHLHHINRKLRTHNRLEAVIHALKRGLI